jgi:hypothetical protein
MDSGDKSNTINTTEYFPTIFRYIVLVIILFFIFFFLKKKSTQFILFIVIFIVNFFTIVFLCRDLIATNVVSSLFDPSMSLNLQQGNGIYVKIFIGTLLLTLLLQVASIAIIIVVFDYGKNETNNFYTSVLTDQNTSIIRKYILWLNMYFVCAFIFAYIIAVSYMKNEKLRNILINIGCIAPVAFLLGSSIYGTILAVEFLDNKKYKRAIYK